MKITITKTDLQNALDTVSGSMASTGSDLTCHYLFRVPLNGDKDRIEILTHSGHIAALTSAIARVETEEGGATAFTIEGWRLKTWLKGKPDMTVSLTYDGSKHWVEASAVGLAKYQPKCWDSLDPNNWPFWDAMFEGSTKTISISASRLKTALEHGSKFCSTDETRSPEYCVVQAKDGILASTDRIAVSLIEVKDLETSNLRIHVRDMSSVLDFLKNAKDSLVEVYESDRAAFIRRDDNSICVVNRPAIGMPLFKSPVDSDEHFWLLDKGELKAGVQDLLSVVENKSEDQVLYFNRPGNEGPVNLGVKSKTSGKLECYKLEVLESGSDSDRKIPEKGFAVSMNRLNIILSLYPGDCVRFGVNPRDKGGFIRFKNDKVEKDSYTTLLTWLDK